MTTLDSILEHYEKPSLTQDEVSQIKDDASTHLWNYLCGDGDARHLYDYYDCMDKIS